MQVVWALGLESELATLFTPSPSRVGHPGDPYTYLPYFNLAHIAKGIAPNYSDEKFWDYCRESEVIAEEILKNLAE